MGIVNYLFAEADDGRIAVGPAFSLSFSLSLSMSTLLSLDTLISWSSLSISLDTWRLHALSNPVS